MTDTPHSSGRDPMISFIVIGKNEGWRLTKCLESIRQIIVSDHVEHYEIIYVDSSSTDDSLERACAIPGIHVFKLTGICNAAIARNAGARESTGSILFFIDGDMTLLPGAVTSFINEEGKLIYPFCTGLFDNYIHDEYWNFLETSPGNYSVTSAQRAFSYQPVTGGLFLISRELWFKIGGMDTRFVRSQDIDLGLRLANRNILQLKKHNLIVHHYMINYLDKSRIRNFQKMNVSFYRGMLLRKNLFNKHYYRYAIRNDYSGFSLFFLTLIALLYPQILLLYPVILTMRIVMLKRNKPDSPGFFYLLKNYFLRDINLFISFLFFYPKKKELNYIRIK